MGLHCRLTPPPFPPFAGAEQRALLVRQPVREGRQQDEPRGAHRRRPRGFGAFLGAYPGGAKFYWNKKMSRKEDGTHSAFGGDGSVR